MADQLPRRHNRTGRLLVRVGAPLLVGGAVVCIAVVLTGAIGAARADGTIAGVLIAAVAAASFGAGSLLVALFANRS